MQPEPPPGVPTWIGYVGTLISQVGVPTVFAGVLVWFLLTRVGGTLEHIEESEEARTKILTELQVKVLDALTTQTQAFVAAMQTNIETNERIVQAVTSRARPRTSSEPAH